MDWGGIKWSDSRKTPSEVLALTPGEFDAMMGGKESKVPVPSDVMDKALSAMTRKNRQAGYQNRRPVVPRVVIVRMVGGDSSDDRGRNRNPDSVRRRLRKVDA